MATLDQIRAAVERHIDSTGLVRDSELAHRFNLSGTIAEVVSLSPARVEILSGPTVAVDAYVGAVPTVGDIVLVVEVAHFRIVISGIEVI